MAIYLKEYIDKKPKNIKELITTLYQHLDSDTVLKSVATYNDVECTDLECPANKFRSADALVEIVQTYFPKATEKEIFTELFNTVIIYDNSKYYIYLYYCYDICKPVFYFHKGIYQSNLDESAEDNYDDETDKPYENESKYYNWEEIINIIGFDYNTLFQHLKTL